MERSLQAQAKIVLTAIIILLVDVSVLGVSLPQLQGMLSLGELERTTPVAQDFDLAPITPGDSFSKTLRLFNETSYPRDYRLVFVQHGGCGIVMVVGTTSTSRLIGAQERISIWSRERWRRLR